MIAENIYKNSRIKTAIFVLIFLSVLSVYFVTLAPTYTWSNNGMDSAEFSLCAKHLGIPHPTGYPIFSLLGKIFSKNPFIMNSDLAFKTNFMSAFFGALAVGVLFLAIDYFAENVMFSALLSLVFAFSRTFWSQSVITEVYTLNTFFVVVFIYSALNYMRSNLDKYLYFCTFIIGLGLCNHATSVLLLPSFCVLFFVGRKKLNLKKLVFLLLILSLCGSVYVYLPLRAMRDPVINTGNPSTVTGFLWVLLAEPYRGQMFENAAFLRNITEYPILNEFSSLFIPIAIIGFWELFKTSAVKSFFLLLTFCSCVLYSLNYRIPDLSAYFIMSYVIYIIWVSIGFFEIAKLSTEKTIFSKIQTNVIIIICLMMAIYMQFSSNYTVVREPYRKGSFGFAKKTFESIPEKNGILFSYEASKNFSLQYYKHEILNGNGPDLVLCGYVVWDWYLEQLKRRKTISVPDFKLEKLKELVIKRDRPDTMGKNKLIWRYFLRSEVIKQLVLENIKTRPVYINVKLPVLSKYFHFGKINENLYKLAIKNG